MLSPSDLQRLSELEAAATPGPWDWEDRDRPDALLGPPTFVDWLPGEPQHERIITTDSGVYGPNAADRDLIAEVRNSLPALLSDIATLKKALLKVAEQLDGTDFHGALPAWTSYAADRAVVAAELRKLVEP